MKKPTRPNGRRKRSAKGAGTLYKRDSSGREHPTDWQGIGSYWLAYTIPNLNGGKGQRIRQMLRDGDGHAITDRDQAEAERKRILAPYQTGSAVETLKAIVARVQSAEVTHVQAVEDVNPALRITEVWTAYLSAPERPDSGDRTLADYEQHWRRFSTWLAAAHPESVYLRDVTPATAGEYAADLMRNGFSPNSYNKHLGFLRLLFRVLGDVARITTNPFAKIKRKVQRPHSRRELTIPELTGVLDQADGDLSLLLLLGASTGLRLGDCCTLTWGDVDLARGIIRRIPNKTAKSGKPVLLGITPLLHERLTALKHRTGYVLPVYAERYRRDVAAVTKVVKTHILECAIDVHAPGTGEQIKRKKDGTPERHKDTGKVITKHTGKPAVVDVGFHSLRHTWVSMHAAAGTPGAIVQASVGHSNPAMTSHYTHVNEATARDVALALPVFGATGSHNTSKMLPAAVHESRADYETRGAQTAIQKAVEALRTMTADSWAAQRDAALAALEPFAVTPAKG